MCDLPTGFPNRFRVVIARATEHFGVKGFHDLFRPFSAGSDSSGFARRAPRVRSRLIRVRPMKANGYTGMHGIDDVLAHKGLVLETMRAATDLARGVGHDAF